MSVPLHIRLVSAMNTESTTAPNATPVAKSQPPYRLYAMLVGTILFVRAFDLATQNMEWTVSAYNSSLVQFTSDASFRGIAEDRSTVSRAARTPDGKVMDSENLYRLLRRYPQLKTECENRCGHGLEQVQGHRLFRV